jgi:hypothetical protein
MAQIVIRVRRSFGDMALVTEGLMASRLAYFPASLAEAPPPSHDGQRL